MKLKTIYYYFFNKLFWSFSESGDFELHQDYDVGKDDTEGDNEAVIWDWKGWKNEEIHVQQLLPT